MATPEALGATIQMTEEAEKKSSSLFAILLAIVVILVAAFCTMYGLQALAWVEGRQWSNVNPWLRAVPQPLPPPSAATKGELVKSDAYQYEFISPWGAEKKINPSLTYSEIRFAPGQVVIFFDPDSQLDTMRVLKSSNPQEYQKFQNVFLDHPIESNYALYQAVYGASPEQMSPLMSSRDAMRMNVLLLWKLSFGFDFGSEVSSFDFGRNKGFQFGDPAKGDPVAVRVFDDRARQHRFIFLVAAGKHAKLTQDDINTVVSTLKPIPILDR
jgi:hypothetical protein